MKSRIRTLSIAALLSGALGVHAAPVLVPNGDFSTPGGEDWTQDGSTSETGATVITYETSGGNPGGYGKIDNTAGSWGGVLVSEGGTGLNPATGDGIELSTLGLTAGETYTFSLDMIDFGSGGTLAGIKIESWNGGTTAISDSGDQNFATTTSWETYSYDYQIDAAATRIKVVPLLSGNQNEVVGFDNVGVDNTPIAPPPFVPEQIENGDFEIPNGVGWGTTQGSPVFNTTGGNPDGHVVLDGNGVFGVLYAFDNTQVTFASLGLAPGDTFIFQADLKLISGIFNAVFRFDGPAGFDPETAFSVIGNGAEWATYSIELTVPASPSEAKFGIRAIDCIMAFDNISIVRPGDNPFTVCIDQGTVVSWTPTSAVNSYQPQESANNMDWTDLGPLVVGDGISSVFDEDGASFYRVQEYSVTTTEFVDDGGFELGGGWTFIMDEALYIPPVEVNNPAEAYAGHWFVRVGADNSVPKEGLTSTSPRSSVMQQSSAVAVTAGNSYDFSLRVWVESGLGANMGYSVKWRDFEDGVIGQTDGSFNSLTPGAWTLVSNPGLVAPEGAVNAFFELVCATGAFEGSVGSYRVDDISLVGAASTFLQDLPATPGDGVVLSWPTTDGASYQVKSSTDLSTFTDLGSPMIGDGSTMTLGEVTATSKFFQVVETP